MTKRWVGLLGFDVHGADAKRRAFAVSTARASGFPSTGLLARCAPARYARMVRVTPWTHLICSSVVAVAGCGRIAFDASSDAGSVLDGDGSITIQGTLDPNFGDAGIAIVDGLNLFSVVDVARRANGYVLCAQTIVPSTITLVATTTTGQVDTTFGTDGVVSLSPTSSNYAEAMIGNQNRLVIAAELYIDTSVDSQAALMLLDHNGNLVPTFGTGGIALWGGAGYDVATAVRFSPTGLSLGATFQYDVASAYTHTAFVDFAGVAAPTYSEDLSMQLGEYVTDLVTVPGGHLLFGLTDSSSFILRYNAGGRDTSFATNGEYTASDGSYAYAGGQLATGDIVMVGERASAAFVRVLSQTGVVRAETPVQAGELDAFFAVATNQATTGFFAAGKVRRNGQDDGLLTRFHDDGTLDTSFGTGGHLEIDLGGNENLTGVNIEPDGAVIAIGEADGGRAVIVRIL